jgi:hypothetical protein
MGHEPPIVSVKVFDEDGREWPVHYSTMAKLDGRMARKGKFVVNTHTGKFVTPRGWKGYFRMECQT